MARSGAVLGGLVLVGGLAACNPPPPPAAQFLVVDSTADTVDAVPGDGLCADSGGACTLRAAVMEANANVDVTEIELVGGETYTLSIPGSDEDAGATGDLDLLAGTYLRPTSGEGLATIDAAGLDRVFDVHADGIHWFKDLSITGGTAGGSADGGAILGRAGTVRVDTSRITGNLAAQRGGGIAAFGAVLTLTDVTVDGNIAGSHGGGIAADTDTRLQQVTVSDNFGGANAAEVWIGGGPLVVKASTLAGDSTALDVDAGAATMERTLLGSPNGCVIGPTGSVTSTGGNIAPDATCNLIGPSDQPGTDAEVGPLGDHGGKLPTRVPSIGSPAIDAVPLDVAGCTAKVGKDQRGIARPVGGGCDSGAVEAQDGEPTGSDCGPPHNLVPGADLERCDLSGMDLSGLTLAGANLAHADLSDATLVDATLVNIEAHQLNLSGADLTRTDLTGAQDRPQLTGTTTFSDTVCPSGATTSSPCDDWALDLVVNHGGDDIDSDPGDGICQDASGAPGDCSLRAAVSESNQYPTSDAISVDASVPTVTLTRAGVGEDSNDTGDLDITDEVSLAGDGATVDGAALDRVVHVRPSGNLTVTEVTLTGGSLTGTSYPEDAGGGVLVEAGSLTVADATISGNSALWGGGIEASGATVTVVQSTLSANQSAHGGSAIDNTGSAVTVTNATISGNTAAGSGAIYADGPTTVTFSTITANGGGGIHNGAVAATVAASIVADQTSGTDCSGQAAASAGHNLESATSCGFVGTGDLQSTPAEVGPLGTNGGPTDTHLPATTSVAVDLVPLGSAGVCDGTIPTDQRSAPRSQANGCDAGAVELDGSLIVGPDCGPPHNLVPGADLHGCDLSGLDLSGLDLTGADLSGADLTGADLTGTTLTDATISGSDLTGTTLAGIRTGGLIGDTAARPAGWFLTGGYLVGPGADLTGAELPNRNWNVVSLEGTILAGANIFGAFSGSVSGTPASLPDNWVLLDGHLIGPGANLTGADLAGKDLSGRWLHYANLTDADLTGADLTGALLYLTNLTNADFTGATFHRIWASGISTTAAALPTDYQVVSGYLVGPGANLADRDLTGVDLSGTNLQNALLTATVLTDVASGGVTGVPDTLPPNWKLTDGYLIGPGADLAGAQLTGSVLASHNFIGADLTGADLSGADLSLSAIGSATLTGADLSGATLYRTSSGGTLSTAPAALPPGFEVYAGWLIGPGVDARHLDLAGGSLTNKVLDGALVDYADLSNANVSGTSFDGAFVRQANLSGATLTNAGFAGANLYQSDLTGALAPDADFSSADLLFATLISAYLERVDLTGAGLQQANLTWANLTDADLTNSRLLSTVVSGSYINTSNLNGVRGAGLIGAPASLAEPWMIRNGYLIGPGANLSGAYLVGQDLTQANLTGADLTAADLTSATLTWVRSGGILGTPTLPTGWTQVAGHLFGAGADHGASDLSGLDLRGVTMVDALVWGTNLDGANLSGVSFERAVLRSISTVGTDLTNTNFFRADAQTSNFTGADVTGASFFDADLYQTTGPGNGTGAAALYGTQTRCSHGGNPVSPDYTCSGYDGW